MMFGILECGLCYGSRVCVNLRKHTRAGGYIHTTGVYISSFIQILRRAAVNVK